MTSCVLAYPNRTDAATLSGGSWTPGLPLSNLQTRPLKRYARTTDTLAASTQFTAALDKVRSISVVALCNHNLSSNAQYRVRLSTDAAFATTVYDSGNQLVYSGAEQYAFGTLAWGSPYWWGGRIDREEYSYYARNVVHVLPTATLATYVKVEIFDTSNTDTYVQIGRLFLSEGWQPVVNMSYGAQIGHQSRSEVEEALDGAEFFLERAPYRFARFELARMEQDEAMAYALDMQRQLDIHQEVMFVWDPTDTTHLVRRSFLGRVRQLSPLQVPFASVHSQNFEIKELL